MNHTILLVDDEANLLEALGRQLHREPRQIVTTRDMSGMKVAELPRRVRQSCPDTIRFTLTGKPTPRAAIGCTAHSASVARQCREETQT